MAESWTLAAAVLLRVAIPAWCVNPNEQLTLSREAPAERAYSSRSAPEVLQDNGEVELARLAPRNAEAGKDRNTRSDEVGRMRLGSTPEVGAWRLGRGVDAGDMCFVSTASSPKEKDPEAAAKHYEAGMALKKAGELKKAADDFRLAIEKDPDYLDAHWALAWTYADLGRDQEAIAEFGEVIRLAPPESEKAKEAWKAIQRLGQKATPAPRRSRRDAAQPGAQRGDSGATSRGARVPRRTTPPSARGTAPRPTPRTSAPVPYRLVPRFHQQHLRDIIILRGARGTMTIGAASQQIRGLAGAKPPAEEPPTPGTRGQWKCPKCGADMIATVLRATGPLRCIAGGLGTSPTDVSSCGGTLRRVE